MKKLSFKEVFKVNSVDKPSRKMISILLVVVLFIICNGLFLLYQINSTQNDSKTINYLGIIRGSIQRISKLEISGIKADALIKKTDEIVYDFYNDKMQLKGEGVDLRNKIETLEEDWKGFKKLIYMSRRVNNNKEILQRSERLWDETNVTVFLAQTMSQRKIKYFDFSILISLFNLILIVVVIYMTKNYVKDKLEYEVNHDALTKIFNRRFLYEYFQKEFEKTQIYRKQMSIIFFDIDYFKIINDTYGHDKGDYVLVEIAKIVRKTIRNNDIFARIGGEEFVIIIPDISIYVASIMAERVRKAIEKYSFEHGIRVTISLGITEHKDGDTLDSIFKRADDALYKSKKTGRNRITITG